MVGGDGGVWGGLQNGAITAQDEAYLPQEEKANLVLRFSDGIVSHFLSGWKSLLIFELQSSPPLRYFSRSRSQ